MTDDLVKRLRAQNPVTRAYTITDEAADRIEKLEKALKRIEDMGTDLTFSLEERVAIMMFYASNVRSGEKKDGP